MTRKYGMMCVLMGLLSVAVVAPASASERDQLQQRFKDRYPTLVSLKRADKVGVTHRGLAAAVQDAYLDDPADPDADDGGMTIEAFLAVENADRLRLYELIAEETGATPAQVARRDAKRRFERAGPDDYLLPAGGEWTRKRDLASD